MDEYEARLGTFGGWEGPVKPEDLAATGLYYTGKGDTVQCCKCGLVLGDWEAGDVPAEEHQKFRKGDCCFTKGCRGTAKSTKGSTAADAIKDNEPNYNPAGAEGGNGAEGTSKPEGATAMPDCMICGERPRSVRLEPCCHFVVCQPCAQKVKVCPVCQKDVEGPSLQATMKQ